MLAVGLALTANAQPVSSDSNLPRVEIVEGKQVYTTGIIVSGGALSTPLPLLPFPAGHVRQAFVLAPDRLVAASDRGQIALIALPKGTALATHDNGDRNQSGWSEIFATRDGRHLVLAGSNRLTILDSRTLAVVRDWRHIERVGGVWTSATIDQDDPRWRGLFTVDHPDLEIVEISGPVRELGDGRLMAVLGTNVYKDAPTRHGTYRFDIATGQVERHLAFRGARDGLSPREGDFFALSPSGRYGLRRHFDAVPLGAKPGGRRPSIANAGTHADHPDVKADGMNRFGVVIELWDLAGEPRLLRKIVTRMSETSHIYPGHFGHTASEKELIEAAAKTDLATSKPFVQSYPKLVSESETNAALARVKEHYGIELRKVAKELGLDEMPAQTPPSEKTINALMQSRYGRVMQELMAALAGIQGQASGKSIEAYRLRLPANTIADVIWDDNETGFWVRFNPHVLRRVGIDGSLSPLVAFERLAKRNDLLAFRSFDGSAEHVHAVTREADGRFRFSVENLMSYSNKLQQRATMMWDPAGLQGGAQDVVVVRSGMDSYTRDPAPTSQAVLEALLRTSASTKIPLAGDTEADAIAALEVLKARIEAGLEALKYDDFIRVDFMSNDRAVVEKQFFESLVNRNWRGTVPALRGAIRAYLDRIQGGDGDTPWHTAHAIRALVLLDPDQRDVYRTYLQKRDGRASYEAMDLYWEFIARHGYRNAEDIRFGIFVVLNTLWGGVSPEDLIWRKSGVLQAAERLMKPEQFAALVIGELKAFAPVEQRWDFQTDSYYSNSLLKLLERGEVFQKNTAKALRTLLGSR